MTSHVSFWRANGLSLVLGAFFVVFLLGQFASGFLAWNAQLQQAGQAPVGLAAYAHSGHFIAATFENWESEFLQMGAYVLLTVWLRQRGSAESRPLDEAEDARRVDAGPRPWPVRRGGLWQRLYATSLSLALFVLFAASFAGHLYGSWRHAVDERALQGQPPITLPAHLGSAEFWFESFQNWQSEFLAVLALVLLSIVLRQDTSPESKPLEAPHAQTGD